MVIEPRAGGLTWLSPAGAFPSIRDQNTSRRDRKYPETVALAQQKGRKDEEVRTWTIKKRREAYRYSRNVDRELADHICPDVSQ